MKIGWQICRRYDLKTAVDTNVASRLWRGSPSGLEASRLLYESQKAGALVICPVVYAEMLANPTVSEGQVHLFLEQMGFSTELEMPAKVWAEAGLRFGRYAERRKLSGGGEPRRLLADFVVGAHAMVQCDRLLTFDVKRYEVDFPELKLVDTGG